MAAEMEPFASAAAALALVEGQGGGALNAFGGAGVSRLRVQLGGEILLGGFEGSGRAGVRIPTVTPLRRTGAVEEAGRLGGAADDGPHSAFAERSGRIIGVSRARRAA